MAAGTVTMAVAEAWDVIHADALERHLTALCERVMWGPQPSPLTWTLRYGHTAPPLAQCTFRADPWATIGSVPHETRQVPSWAIDLRDVTAAAVAQAMARAWLAVGSPLALALRPLVLTVHTGADMGLRAALRRWGFAASALDERELVWTNAAYRYYSAPSDAPMPRFHAGVELMTSVPDALLPLRAELMRRVQRGAVDEPEVETPLLTRFLQQWHHAAALL